MIELEFLNFDKIIYFFKISSHFNFIIKSIDNLIIF